jgi:hypothetical protein
MKEMATAMQWRPVKDHSMKRVKEIAQEKSV